MTYPGCDSSDFTIVYTGTSQNISVDSETFYSINGYKLFDIDQTSGTISFSDYATPFPATKDGRGFHLHINAAVTWSNG